ncbi:hypothetical protein AMJ80_01870 [bacterium SM23_31]|nr:MAG: hypothetical protein AMJ80_01870 [bacterium SM23_31]
MKKIVVFVLLGFIGFNFCTKNPAENKNDDFNDDEVMENKILVLSKYKDYDQIYALEPDGSFYRSISLYYGDTSSDRYYWVAWAPDRKKIAVSGGPDTYNDMVPLWLMDMRGNLVRKLTYYGEKPVWTKDSKKIFFTKPFYGQAIYSVNVDGTDEKLFYYKYQGTIFKVNDISISGEYILGSESIMFINDEGKHDATDNEIIKYNTVNEERVYLTDNELQDRWPRFSPDEKLIAFERLDKSGSYEDKLYNIYVISSDGTNERRITNEPPGNSIGSFSWSPDGKKIAFSKSDESSGYYNPYYDIFTVDVETGELLQITDTAKDSVDNRVIDWE